MHTGSGGSCHAQITTPYRLNSSECVHTRMRVPVCGSVCNCASAMSLLAKSINTDVIATNKYFSFFFLNDVFVSFSFFVFFSPFSILLGFIDEGA